MKPIALLVMTLCLVACGGEAKPNVTPPYDSLDAGDAAIASSDVACEDGGAGYLPREHPPCKGDAGPSR